MNGDVREALSRSNRCAYDIVEHGSVGSGLKVRSAANLNRGDGWTAENSDNLPRWSMIPVSWPMSNNEYPSETQADKEECSLVNQDAHTTFLQGLAASWQVALHCA